MKYYEILGYAYDADTHCVGCTHERFPGLNCDTLDSEGNEVHPIFASEEGAESEYCSDCGQLLGDLHVDPEVFA